jgi:hypothetical protein
MNRCFPLLLCASFCLVGCEDEGSDDISITYLQGGCRGNCPSFSIAVNKDRSFQYIGLRNVLIVDTVLGRLTNQQFLDLIETFQQSNYFDLNDEYVAIGVTDMASAVTSIRLGARFKSIRHYFGDRTAPNELKVLYSKINRTLNTQQWVGHEVILAFPDDGVSSTE